MGADQSLNKYLVVYDYDTGGLWGFIYAECPDEIEGVYPELEVVNRPPDWMTPEVYENLERENTFRIHQPTGWLAKVVEGR